jgi:Signal transduction histidine kinase regulating citrate/malate metabolism
VQKLSENVRNLFSDNQIFRKRFFVIFLLIIYIPVSINLYAVYTKTIEIVKNEKIQDMTDIINKSATIVEMYLSDVTTKLTETGESYALRKVVVDRNSMNKVSQDKSDTFFTDEFKKIKNDKITGVFCITNTDNSLFTTSGDIEISNLIINSTWYKNFMKSDKDIILHKGQFEAKQDDKDIILIISKLKSPENNPQKKDSAIGALVFTLNSGFWDSIIQNNNNNYNISLYCDDYVLIGNDFKDNAKVYDLYKNEALLTSFTKIDKNTIVSIKYLSKYNIYMVSNATTENFLNPILNSIQNSVFMLLIIGCFAIIWILMEFMVVSKLTIEKHMSQLKLLASEEANQRFRIFKHDLMNHLQIIQGLIQMNQYDKALEYSRSLTNESRLIVSRWNIGIPELESAIFQSLSGLDEYKIDVQLDFCPLPQDISVKIYDLVKIIVNLIKNAAYELQNTDVNEKILKIKISEGVGEYIFEVANNVPLIPENQRKLIFNKGYTTKGSKGNGLGLHIVKTLTERNMGNVELNVDEEGNHFIVRFPN